MASIVHEDMSRSASVNASSSEGQAAAVPTDQPRGVVLVVSSDKGLLYRCLQHGAQILKAGPFLRLTLVES